MKSSILLIGMLLFGSLTTVHGQTPAQIKVKPGKQKVAFKVLKVKFVSVVEDSRCPIGTNCVWAGNAQVEIQVRKSKGAWKTLKLNTGMGDQSAVFEGFEIKLSSLTPHPAENIRIDPRKYEATFAVRRI